jgi:hypothetical protein
MFMSVYQISYLKNVQQIPGGRGQKFKLYSRENCVHMCNAVPGVLCVNLSQTTVSQGRYHENYKPYGYTNKIQTTNSRMPHFLFIFIFYDIHTFIQSQYIYPSSFAEASLHFLIACMLSGENFPVVPSRELNWGMPYSKPTRCQLSHAAP